MTTFRVRISLYATAPHMTWHLEDDMQVDDRDQPTAGAAVSDAVDALAARVRAQVDARFGDQPSPERES